jgi:hypothetical protein
MEDNMLRGSAHYQFDSFGGHGPQRRGAAYAIEEEMDFVEEAFEDPPLDDIAEDVLDDNASYGQDDYPLTQYGDYY